MGDVRILDLAIGRSRVLHGMVILHSANDNGLVIPTVSKGNHEQMQPIQAREPFPLAFRSASGPQGGAAQPDNPALGRQQTGLPAIKTVLETPGLERTLQA